MSATFHDSILVVTVNIWYIIIPVVIYLVARILHRKI